MYQMCLNKPYNPKQIIPTVPRKELLIVLPFVRTCFSKSVSKTLPQCNIKVIFQSKNS